VSSVQFSPGQVRNCYNQTIIDNTSAENPEIFDLVILMNNSEIIIGNCSLSQIIILDDDIKGINCLHNSISAYY